MGTLRTDGLITLTDSPILFWDNVITATIVDAESDADFPASNVANPSTALKWKHDATDSPESAVEYFRVDVSQTDVINYIAIAGHNFASQNIAVGLELASWSSPVGGASSVIAPAVPADDGPILFLFTTQEIEEIRIILVTGNAPAEIAVLYAGEYTVLPEGVQEDHTPLPLAQVSDVTSGKAESGSFLGRIVTGGSLVSAAVISNLDWDWIYSDLMPFLEQADEFPFFWAWAPSTYPDDTAFAWLENDAQPSFDIDGFASVTLAMRGLA
jgi:hypothetical protein